MALFEIYMQFYNENLNTHMNGIHLQISHNWWKTVSKITFNSFDKKNMKIFLRTWNNIKFVSRSKTIVQTNDTIKRNFPNYASTGLINNNKLP